MTKLNASQTLNYRFFKVHLVFQSCLHSSPNTGGALMLCMFHTIGIAGQKVRLSFHKMQWKKSNRNVWATQYFAGLLILFTIWYLSRLPPDYHMLHPFPIGIICRFLLKSRNIPYSSLELCFFLLVYWLRDISLGSSRDLKPIISIPQTWVPFWFFQFYLILLSLIQL